MWSAQCSTDPPVRGGEMGGEGVGVGVFIRTKKAREKRQTKTEKGSGPDREVECD